MTTIGPIVFSIILLSTREPRIEQQEYSYSANIQLYTNCPSKEKSNVTLIFYSRVAGRIRCSSPFKQNLTCTNLTYGAHYTIDGFIRCEKQRIHLLERKERFEIATPKYINSTSTSTSIDALFLVPGLFYQLIVKIASIDRTCSIRHSDATSPFYNCSFYNLPPAESFNLTYYLLTESNRSSHGDPTIVYTDLEELNFSCQLDETNQQMLFYWSNLTSSGYNHLSMSILIEQKSLPWRIHCDPYQSQGNCSSKQYRLEPGTEYHITAKLTKDLLNYNAEKTGRCSIKTPLDTVKNLEIVNVSLVSRRIQVRFDKPSGNYEELILICENNSSKEEKSYFDSASWIGPIPNETCRIYVETRRNGWKTVRSNKIETEPIFSSEGITLSSLEIILLFIITGISLIGFIISIFVYRGCRRKQSAKKSTTINNKITTTKPPHMILDNIKIPKPFPRKNPTKNILITRPIRIQDLIGVYEKLIANNCFRASDEFEKLQNNLQDILPFTQYNEPLKNRYKDIIPYEHTRVKLNPVNESDSGYINANFINGLNDPHEYIACQSPLKTTINDHWKMIWEQNVAIVVMLSCLIERGVNKCEQYWPTKLNHADMFGDISVSVINWIKLPHYDLRNIQLKKHDEIRLIKHYAFKMWNEHTVPTNTDQLINFIRFIRSQYRPKEDGIMLVHCSAGVGRSGTFIALDRLLQQFDKLPIDGYLDIYGTVLDMRKCRDKMVQTEDQYLFLYRCLKEEFQRRSGESTTYDTIC